MIKIFGGGRGGDTFKTPSPLRTIFCLYPPPVLRCFWRDPLMTPSTTPLEASFTATPSPSTTPSIKILIIQNHSPLIFSVIDVFLFFWGGGGGGVRVHNIKLSSCLLFCLFLCINMRLSISDKATY